MRMKIYSCLLAFVLCCNVSAEKKEKIIRPKDSVTLPCPHPVEGKVTWSREKNGNRVDILTVDGDRDIRHIHDPLKRYSSSADKSLHISRAAVSDAGTYFCNNEAPVELTVIPDNKEPTTTTTTPPPPATTLSPPPETSIPPPPLTRQTTSEPLPAATTAPSTPLVNTGTSTVSTTQPAMCDQPSECALYLWSSVHIVVGILCLIIILSITVTSWRKARQTQGQHTAATENDPPSHESSN